MTELVGMFATWIKGGENHGETREIKVGKKEFSKEKARPAEKKLKEKGGKELGM